MNRPSRLKLSDVNPNLICVLCGGYFIDATTIVECLHSFCKTCIVRYLETSKYCPICDVQVHKTKPLQNIRADHTLQNIVYKLVPGLYQHEMKQRQEFYACHPEVSPASEYDAGVINEETSCIYCPDETVALCLEYSGKASSNIPAETTKSEHLISPASKDYHRRYFRCPAAVTVSHLKKLLRSKYGISAEHRVDVMYNDELLKEEYSLMDVAYIYLWRRKGVMRFTYRIFERPHKRRRLDLERSKTSPSFVAGALKSELLGNSSEIKAVEDCKDDGGRLIDDQIPLVPHLNSKVIGSEMTKEKCDMSVGGDVAVSGSSGEEWKEVQLQISENGVMSVRNLDDLVSAVEGGMLSSAYNETIISSGKAEESSGELKGEVSGTVTADSSKIPGKAKEIGESSKENVSENHVSSRNQSVYLDGDDVGFKPQSVVGSKDSNGPSSLPSKGSRMDNVCEETAQGGVRNSFPKKEINSKPKDVNSKEVKSEVETSVASSECLPSNYSPQPGATVAVSNSVNLTAITASASTSSVPSAPTIPRKSNSAPVGYKTLKTPPKTWNPSIPRSRVLANHSAYGKAGVGNVNGSLGAPGQSVPSSKAEGRADGKVSCVSSEGGGVRLPPSPKPLRFFKMRNNMPRYLGNPSSGVKPMYSLHPGASGGAAPVPSAMTPKPPSLTKGESYSSAELLPSSSSAVPECKPDKTSAVPAKAAFAVTPTSRSGHKALISPTAAPASHAPSAPFVQTCAATSSAQLPISRTSTAPVSTVSGFHPSLPPSISMIFGQSRPGEKAASQTPPPPAVQRVPASVHHFHHPVTPIHLLQHRQVTKAPGKLNGELSASVESKPKPLNCPAIGLLSPSEVLKPKEGPSRESAVKEPVNGKIEGSGVPAIAPPPPPLVDGKSVPPSKC